MALRAGAARIDITPPVGQPMAGFPQLKITPTSPTDTALYIGRQGVSQGTHDPLYARALVLDNGQTTLALVAVDLIQVSAAFTAYVRAAVNQAVGIPPAHVLLAASHTHAGPDLLRWEDGLQPGVEETIRQQVVDAIVEAYGRRRPARLGWADSHLGAISINRRDPSGPIDPRVGVMLVEDEDAEPIALAVNFAIHTCMLSGLNLLYSADVSGFAMTALEAVYPGAPALFLNGAAGNINPVAYVWGPKMDAVPVFRRAWHAGQPHPRTFRNTARLGRILASAALAAVEGMEERHIDVALGGVVRPVALPLRSPDELARCIEFMNLSPRSADARWHGDAVPTEVQALRIGSTIYTGLPGEPLVELGLDLQQRLAPRRAYVVGYANDDARYVLPRAFYQDNRYDTWGSFVAPGSGELLVAAAYEAAEEALDGR